MSYIRNGSNPEGLYVWGGNLIELSWTDSRGNIQDASCSYKTWNGLFKKMWNNDLFVSEGSIYYGKNICVREVCYRWKYHKPISDKLAEKLIKKYFKACNSFSQQKINKKYYKQIKKDTDWSYLIELRIKESYIYMWMVTWLCLKHNVFSSLGFYDKKKSNKKSYCKY